MPFVKFEVKTKSTAGAGTGAKVSLSKRKSERPSPAVLAISLNKATAAELGFSAGDKLEVMVGEGDCHGLIRLRKNNSVGTAVVHEKKAGRNVGTSYLSISLGHVPNFVDRKEAARHINFETVDEAGGWVEFVMPKWADETGPRAKPGVGGTGGPPRLGAPGPLGHRTGASVTAGIMGDPPPGRREALEKLG